MGMPRPQLQIKELSLEMGRLASVPPQARSPALLKVSRVQRSSQLHPRTLSVVMAEDDSLKVMIMITLYGILLILNNKKLINQTSACAMWVEYGGLNQLNNPESIRSIRSTLRLPQMRLNIHF